MAWNGTLTASSAIGSKITWYPDSPEKTDPSENFVNVKTYAGNYSVSSFTAPKRGVYRFRLKGSGGVKLEVSEDGDAKDRGSAGGNGGSTTGYLLLNAGETVYVGAGGVCRAAFVSATNESSLANVEKSDLYFVAGGGGSGGAYHDSNNGTGYNCKTEAGGNGGGTSGASGVTAMDDKGGSGGTQSAGGSGGASTGSGNNANGSAGSRGLGGTGSSSSAPNYGAWGGRGGDGYYGGGGGACSAADNGIAAAGGGGGSGYVKNVTLTVNGKSYTSETARDGGSSYNKPGSVEVTYYALADTNIYFNGIHLTEIHFNGQSVVGLIYGSARIFAERMRRWLRSMAIRFECRLATQAL